MRKRYLKKIVSSLLAICVLASSTNIVLAEDKNFEIETVGEEIPIEGLSSVVVDDMIGVNENKTGYIDAGIKYDRIPDYTLYDTDGYNKATQMPSSYTSVDKDYVTSVKNQNPWGTCWAFAAVAAMESYALTHGLVDSPEDINLSEFALAYLTFEDEDMLLEKTGDYSDINSLEVAFDAGGNDEMAYKALSNGLALYNDDDEQYKQSQNSGIVPKINWSEDNISYVLTGQKHISMEDRDQVKAAVIENGAVTTAYYSHSKYYNNQHLYNYNYELSSTNHAVAIVGWDDNKSKELFTVGSGSNTHTPRNDGAWLIKNSWGTGWGDQGYIWISYEDFGILASDAVVYEIAPKNQYENLYQHDGATIAYYYVYGYCFASVFDIESYKEIVNAVSFNTYSTQIGYTVYLYDNSNGSELDKGELVATASGRTTYAGYYTVDLDTDYIFMRGDKFTVIVEFDSRGTMLYALDKQDLAYKGMAYSTHKEGQSYIQQYQNEELRDVAELSCYENISLKAHSLSVKDENAPTKISEAKYIGDGQVEISWKSVENAVSYELWKGDSESGNQYKVITGITSTTYIDNANKGSSNSLDIMEYGDTYYYKVRAVYSDGTTNNYSDAKKVDIVPGKVETRLVVEENKLKISWDKLSYADGYTIYIGVDSKDDLVKVADVDSSVTSYIYDEQLLYFNTYYVAITPYVLNNQGIKINGKYDVEDIWVEVVEAKIVDDHYTVEGSLFLEWEIISGNLYDGISITVHRNGIFAFNSFIETTDTSYVLDVSRFNPGDILNINCGTFYEVDNGTYVTSTFYMEELQVGDVFDEEVHWYVKDNQIYVYMPSTAASEYEILYNYNENKVGFDSSIKVTKEEMKAGYPIPVEDCPITGCKIGVIEADTGQLVPKELISVGGEYKAPQIKTIPNVRVSSDGSATLQAIITNKMENFDYQYQWYVSDTKNGNATPISGATAEEYVAYVEDSATKYYFCEVTCQYNGSEIYTTVNENGERTRVLGKNCFGNVTISDISAQNYTGSAIKPSVIVMEDNKKLVEGTHYNITYENNVNAGTAIVKITFIGAYSAMGSKIKEFKINSLNISSVTVETISDQIYTGTAIKPQLVIKNGSRALVLGTDYEVSYSNNTEIGTATVVITAKGNYTGTITKTFNIVKVPASKISVGNINALAYTGQALLPEVVVKYGNVTLIKGTDYEVSYSNNTVVGTGNVTITLKGKYSGQLAKTFAITAKQISGVIVSSISDYTYTGSAVTPSVTVKDGSKTLTLGVDYTVTYNSNINAGTATLNIVGKGNYAGTKSVNFKIIPVSSEGITIGSISNYVYSGSYITPAVTVKNGSVNLVNGTDYTVAYSNNLNAGVANVSITFKGNYKGTRGVTFNIEPKDIYNISIGSIDEQTYTGSAITPELLVMDSSVTLVEDKDYTVTYANNIECGMASIIISGKGNYTGEKTFMFYIVKSNSGNTEPTIPDKITSSSVSVTDSSSCISKITSGTTVATLVSKLNESKYIAVYNGATKLDNNAIVGTGMTVCLMDGGNITKKYTVVITGDTSGDGKINITDMIAVKAHVLKKSTLSGAYSKAGDVNGDSKINITDFIKIKASLLGKDSISGVAVN